MNLLLDDKFMAFCFRYCSLSYEDGRAVVQMLDVRMSREQPDSVCRGIKWKSPRTGLRHCIAADSLIPELEFKTFKTALNIILCLATIQEYTT